MTVDGLTLHEVQCLNRGQDIDETYHRAAAVLAAGRLEVLTRTARVLEAETIGTTGHRHYIRGDLDGIRCSCPGWHHRHHCTHLDAVQLVVAEPGYRRLPPNNLPPT